MGLHTTVVSIVEFAQLDVARFSESTPLISDQEDHTGRDLTHLDRKDNTEGAKVKCVRHQTVSVQSAGSAVRQKLFHKQLAQ